MKVRPGLKLRSAVSDAEVVVVKAPDADVDVCCGGVSMVADGDDVPTAEPATGDGPLIGKRYADDEVGLEVLCSKSGAGELSVDGRPIAIKGAKPLPASD